MTKPLILLQFDFSQEFCKWWSFGWSDDEALMKIARRAISAGKTPTEVVDNLKPHFRIQYIKKGH